MKADPKERDAVIRRPGERLPAGWAEFIAADGPALSSYLGWVAEGLVDVDDLQRIQGSHDTLASS